MTTQTFTELEQKVIDAIRAMKADGNELIYAGDIEFQGINTKQARGAMASLVQKRVIYVDKDNDGLISLFI